MAFFKAFRWLCGYILIPLPFFFGCSVWLCLFSASGFSCCRCACPDLLSRRKSFRSLYLRICAMRPVCAARTLFATPERPRFPPCRCQGNNGCFHNRPAVGLLWKGRKSSSVRCSPARQVRDGRDTFQPQGEEREVVHESLEDVACLLRLRLSYMGDVLRCYASLEMLVAYLVSSRTVGEAYSIVWGFPGQIADLPAFSFCQFRIYSPLPQVGIQGGRGERYYLQLPETRL